MAYFLGDPQAPGYQAGDGWAIMLRRYALDANLPWDTYLKQSGINWDTARLGDGGNVDWSGYSEPGQPAGMAADPSGTNILSIRAYQNGGYTGTGGVASTGGSYSGGTITPTGTPPPSTTSTTNPGAGTPTGGGSVANPNGPGTGPNTTGPVTNTTPGGTNPGSTTTTSSGGNGTVVTGSSVVTQTGSTVNTSTGAVNQSSVSSSSGTSQQTGSTTGSTMSGVSPQLQALFNMLSSSGTDLFQKMMGPNAAQMPGTVANLTPDQLQAQQMMRDTAGSFNKNFIDPTRKQQGQFYANAQDPFNNPALKQMMEQNAQTINQSASDPGGIWSQIRTNSLDANQFGGSRQGIAEGIAAGRIADQIKQSNTGLLNNAYNTAQSNALGAMAQNPAIAGLASMPANMMSAVGQQNYDQSTRQLQDNLAKFMFQYQQPMQAMQMLGGVFNTGLPTGSGSTATGSQVTSGSQTSTGTSSSSGTSTGVNTGQTTGTTTGQNTQTTTLPDWYIELMKQQGQGGNGSNALAALLALFGIGGAISGVK